jgi:hypothetical protein
MKEEIIEIELNEETYTMLALQNQKAMYDFSVSNMKLNTHSRLFFTRYPYCQVMVN